MELSAAIQHHPSRSELIPALLAAIPHATVAIDPAPDVRSDWKTARLAWLAFDPEASHHLVIEDDAVPCSHFLEGVRAAIQARPEHALCFYANRSQIGEALQRGESWTWCRGRFYNNQAVILPTGWIRSFVAMGDGEPYGDRPGIDWRLRDFLKGLGTRILYSAPCLVQHGRPEGSLLWPSGGGMPRRRVTSYFADDLGIDVREIDWTKGDA